MFDNSYELLSHMKRSSTQWILLPYFADEESENQRGIVQVCGSTTNNPHLHIPNLVFSSNSESSTKSSAIFFFSV